MNPPLSRDLVLKVELQGDTHNSGEISNILLLNFVFVKFEICFDFCRIERENIYFFFVAVKYYLKII